MGELSRRYCDEAGKLHQLVARQCEQVILMVAGLPHTLKGNPCD
jgi:adenosylcobinamide kinase/adenosylcobinamide-phosphate guanylyltransferase